MCFGEEKSGPYMLVIIADMVRSSIYIYTKFGSGFASINK